VGRAAPTEAPLAAKRARWRARGPSEPPPRKRTVLVKGVRRQHLRLRRARRARRRARRAAAAAGRGGGAPQPLLQLLALPVRRDLGLGLVRGIKLGLAGGEAGVGRKVAVPRHKRLLVGVGVGACEPPRAGAREAREVEVGQVVDAHAHALERGPLHLGACPRGAARRRGAARPADRGPGGGGATRAAAARRAARVAAGAAAAAAAAAARRPHAMQQRLLLERRVKRLAAAAAADREGVVAAGAAVGEGPS
jgi:hypothetical protein